MSISLAKTFPVPLPTVAIGANANLTGAANPSGGSYVPPGAQAQGQVAGALTTFAPSFTNSIITSTASTTGFMTGGGGGYVIVNQAPVQATRKPRRPREKRDVPLFTAGLEAKLNKTLDKDARQILRYIARKVQQMPTIVDSINEDVYEFSTVLQYTVQTGVNWWNNANAPTLPSLKQHTVRFYAKLFIRNDGSLREYEIRMGGAKQ